MPVSEEERREREGLYSCSSSERLEGTKPVIELYHIRAVLYLIRSEIGSQ